MHAHTHSSYVTGFEEEDSSPFSTVPNQMQKLRGGLGAGLCRTMLLPGTTLVLNYPQFLNHFQSLTGPIKFVSKIKETKKHPPHTHTHTHTPESQFCATAVRQSMTMWACVWKIEYHGWDWHVCALVRKREEDESFKRST